MGHPPLRLLTDTVDPYWLLRVLNSSVFWMFVKHNAPTMGEGRHVYRIQVLRRFPLALPYSPKERASGARISPMVERALRSDLNVHGRRKMAARIDQLVCDLYGVPELAGSMASHCEAASNDAQAVASPGGPLR
jgi:hypothetical protein